MGAPKTFVSGDKPKTFYAKEKTPHEEKSPHKVEKAPHIISFPGGGGEQLPLPLLRAFMSKSEYEMLNIFGNYSSHNYTKNTL